MKATISRKLFLGFSILSFLTLAMAVTIFIGLKNLGDHQESLQKLQDFKLQVKALEAYNVLEYDNLQADPSVTYKGFTADLARAEKLAAIFLEDRALSKPGNDPGEVSLSRKLILEKAMFYYKQAALEVIEKSQNAYKLFVENYRIHAIMVNSTRNMEDSEQPQTLLILHDLELLKHRLSKSYNPTLIKKLKMKRSELESLAASRHLVSQVDNFILNLEKIYFNHLAIRNKQEFLSQSTTNFQNIANATFLKIEEDIKKGQYFIIYTITFMCSLSVVLTLLFWVFTSRRLSSFLQSQKKAVQSIRTKDFDYDPGKTSKDEFGDLCLFTKDMAMSLKEEITEKETAEREKNQLEHQLQQAQKLESIGLLAGGVAHDFNNLLTGITGYADLVLAKLEKDDPLRQYIETIIDTGDKASALTRQLLTFSRKQEIAKKSVDINKLIENLLKMLTRVISEDIILKFETSPDLCNTLADPTQIEQAILNLAINARHAMPHGGLLTIRTSMATLGESEVKGRDQVDPGEFIRISVEDTGSGIPEKVVGKIFDPFFTTKDSEKGTGLGLATTYGAITQHNGFITVESRPGKTVFSIFLPVINRDGMDEKNTRTTSNLTPTGNESILLVDDNDTVREFIQEVLEFLGYQVLSANDGKSALRYLDNPDNSIDLVLTDVIMPGMNGKELADIVIEKIPDMKIIFMSGYPGDIIDLNAIDENPSFEFLKKPLSADTINTKVREMLDKKQ